MTVNMHPDLIKGLLTLAGTGIGYAIREYQNRIVPFFQVYKIDGSSVAGWEMLDIPKEVQSELSDTFYINELEQREAFVSLYKCWDSADDIKRFWPKVKPLITRTLSSAKDSDFEEAIYKLCDDTWFDRWFTRLVAKSQLHFEPSKADLPIKIHVMLDAKDEKKNGTLWISTAFGATAFGEQMNNPAMFQRYGCFIDNLEKLDGDRIKKPLTDFQEILEKEYQISLKVVDPLKKLVDSCSRWMFYIAFTNLSNNPAVIEQNAEVYVTDGKKETKKPYKLECQIAKVSNENGQEKVHHTNAPISFKSGETIQFAVFTKLSQRAMELGDDVRTIFDRGSGRCEVVLHIQKPGLFKKQKARSTMIIFKKYESGR